MILVTPTPLPPVVAADPALLSRHEQTLITLRQQLAGGTLSAEDGWVGWLAWQAYATTLSTPQWTAQVEARATAWDEFGGDFLFTLPAADADVVIERLRVEHGLDFPASYSEGDLETLKVMIWGAELEEGDAPLANPPSEEPARILPIVQPTPTLLPVLAGEESADERAYRELLERGLAGAPITPTPDFNDLTVRMQIPDHQRKKCEYAHRAGYDLSAGGNGVDRRAPQRGRQGGRLCRQHVVSRGGPDRRPGLVLQYAYPRLGHFHLVAA